MNKADLIEALAPRLGGRSQAALAVESIVDIVLRQVAAGESVGVTGFGVFERVDRAARTGRNPRTGEAVPIGATSTPRFRPAAYFKDIVADPSALPADGLAGVRVGTHEMADERAGAPASVRRTTPERAAPEAAPAPREKTQPAPARKATSGRPATVRKTAPPQEDLTSAGDEPAASSSPARGGRMMIAGEDITRSMISAKKAQLAKVKNDRVAAKEEKGKKSEDKKSGKKAPAKRAGAKKDKKSGKKGKKSKA